jgi:hypothetical protein
MSSPFGTRQREAPVNQHPPTNLVIAAAAAVLASCGMAQSNVANSGQVAQSVPATEGNHVTDANLPINQRFKSLDDYLAWLQQTAAPVDRPWYKEIRPGVYELQTAGNLHLDVPSDVQRTFTREELERKFGFHN